MRGGRTLLANLVHTNDNRLRDWEKLKLDAADRWLAKHRCVVSNSASVDQYQSQFEPVSSVAEVIVASGGAILVKSLQFVAIAGTPKAVEPANDSASRAKRRNMCCMVSLPFSPARSHSPHGRHLSQLLASWQICLDYSDGTSRPLRVH